MQDTVLLYYPRTERENTSRHYPYSIVSVATVLTDKGYNVRVIDARFEDNPGDVLLQLKGRIAMAGLSVMTGYQIVDGLAFSKLLREVQPGVKIVWGGWHTSLLPEQTLENEYVDIAVVGQGEPVIADIVDACKGEKNPGEVPNIYFKENGVIRKTTRRLDFSIRDFPQPRVDLLKVENYIQSSDMGERTMFYYTSQGCPFRCGFCCDMAVYKRRWQSRSSGEVLDFLSALKEKYRIDSVVLLDTNFFINKKRVEEIAAGLIERGLEIKWEASVRTDQIVKYEEEFLELIRKSGCYKLFIGAESGSDEVLEFINKDTTVAQTYGCAEKLADAGIKAEFYIIAGFPQSPEDDLNKSMQMVYELKSSYPDHEFTPFLYTPYPGTVLFEKSIEHGFKPPQRLEDWSGWSVLSVHTPWVDDKYQDRYYSFVKYYYPVAFPSEGLKRNITSHPAGFLLKLLGVISRYRIRKNFFYMRFDWRIVKWIKRFQERYNVRWIKSIR
jgi:radical SAM superfamily enzyme YgiQ (UPF0313 family)